MNINVFVERQEENGYRATCLTLPGFAVEAPTRAAALEQLRQLMQTHFARGEMTTVALDLAEEPHPLMAAAGCLKDHPDLAEVEENVRERRRQIDADPNWP